MLMEIFTFHIFLLLHKWQGHSVGEALDGALGHPTEHTARASPGAGGLSLLACLPWWKENEASEVWD